MSLSPTSSSSPSSSSSSCEWKVQNTLCIISIWLKIAGDRVKKGFDIVSASCLRRATYLHQNRFPHLPNKILWRRIFWRICGAASQPLSCLFWAGKVASRVFPAKKGSMRFQDCSMMKPISSSTIIIAILITVNMIIFNIFIFTRFMMRFEWVGGLALPSLPTTTCTQVSQRSALFYISIEILGLWLQTCFWIVKFQKPGNVEFQNLRVPTTQNYQNWPHGKIEIKH